MIRWLLGLFFNLEADERTKRFQEREELEARAKASGLVLCCDGSYACERTG